MNKILIIGADGQLAFDLKRVLKTKHKVIGVGHDKLDIVEAEKVEKYIKKIKPDIVINTAAFHKVLECELNPQKSFDVNALGAFNVAKAAAMVNARIFFISTNYVFDGKKKTYSENDYQNPLNIYGASKVAGEILTKIANPKHYIIRTSGLFGKKLSGKGHNFLTLMITKAENKEELKVVNDEFCCLTYSIDLAQAIEKLISNKRYLPGIYHLTNSGFGSWFDYANAAISAANIEATIKPIKTSQMQSIVKRPPYSILNNNKGPKLRPWKQALNDFIKKWHPI